MSLPGVEVLAREGRLYPSVILHGADAEGRREAALNLSRILLCEAAPEARPCGECRHCRRIRWPAKSSGDESPVYHPDFQVLERDLTTSTSVGATKNMLKTAQVSPFEARGQVFLIADAQTLTGEAANALLKNLEEPHETAPRHFFLLAPSRLDLLPTLRSRSLSVFLGPAEPLSDEEVEPVAEALEQALRGFAETGSSAYLLTAAAALGEGEGWGDPRAGRPWTRASAAVVRTVTENRVPKRLHRPLLDLGQDLLDAPALRLRGIVAKRILEGLVSRRLGPARQTE